jgi:hypothetical protein
VIAFNSEIGGLNFAPMCESLKEQPVNQHALAGLECKTERNGNISANNFQNCHHVGLSNPQGSIERQSAIILNITPAHQRRITQDMAFLKCKRFGRNASEQSHTGKLPPGDTHVRRRA